MVNTNTIKKLINNGFKKLGYQISPITQKFSILDETFSKHHKLCKKYSMTKKYAMYATYLSTKYVSENQISGSLVECGVFKGGNSMMMAATLAELDDTNREIFLYDTFEGMSEPSEIDVRHDGKNAQKVWKDSQRENHNEWVYSSLDEVKKNMDKVSYPKKNIIFVKGDVCKTLNKKVPENISLLRLDTDFYESTKKELEVLYPRLVKGGVLLIDDYDSWQGARKAVDEYFKKIGEKPLLFLVGQSGRAMIKQ